MTAFAVPQLSTGGLTHVRKTVTFTGGAGAGAVGSVAVFTITGRVWVDVTGLSVFCTTDLVDAGGGSPATLALGVTGNTSLLSGGAALDPADGLDANDWWAVSAAARAVSRSRMEDYVAAAAAVDGPLTPMDSSSVALDREGGRP